MPAAEIIAVGVDFRSSFQYNVASVADASFTRLVFKDGVSVATTGITIAYVSDQEYTVLVNGVTGFPATIGTYDLTVFLTADPNVRWTQSLKVIPGYYQVAGGYVQPIAAFTAVASNGRVTFTGSPLAGATVTVIRPNGTTLTQIVTDVNGLWGSVAFDTTGTHVLTVTKSGYTTVTSSVSITGAVATGPGTDLALAATSAINGISAGQLWAYARRMYQDHVGTKADTEIRELVDEALYQVATARLWPWYISSGGITIRAAYTTGTVAVASGSPTLTLTGGTWPTWAGSAEILLADGVWYTVLSRDSGTVLTLAYNYSGTTLTASAYTCAQYSYSLPADTRIISQVTPGQNWVWGPTPSTRAVLEQAKRTWTAGGGLEQYWAIERGNIYVWPYTTSVDSTLDLLYYRRPPLLVSAGDVADWDGMQLEVIRRAIDFQVSCRGTCVAGDRRTCLEMFNEALSRGSNQDRTATSFNVGLTTGAGDSLLWGARVTG